MNCVHYLLTRKKCIQWIHCRPYKNSRSFVSKIGGKNRVEKRLNWRTNWQISKKIAKMYGIFSSKFHPWAFLHSCSRNERSNCRSAVEKTCHNSWLSFFSTKSHTNCLQTSQSSHTKLKLHKWNNKSPFLFFAVYVIYKKNYSFSRVVFLFFIWPKLPTPFIRK